jgi:deazaflavin-dependent oxidoreductase (nitroreductase family)
MPNDFNASIIDEFRAGAGRVGGPFAGARLLLLTTTGARSGQPHTTPVGYLPDGGRVLVIASAGGADRHPDWYLNLVANPVVTVENGTFTYEARASVLEGEERDLLFARAVEADPGWAAYQSKASRTLPVVALTEIPGPPRTSASSPGEMLRIVHDAFRRELALVRAEVAAAGPALGAQLRVNCLTLCQGLTGHHEREDGGMFPALRAGRPDLAAALDELQAEHESIATLLTELRRLLDDGTASQPDLLREVNRLTGEVEHHLENEEQALTAALNGTG